MLAAHMCCWTVGSFKRFLRDLYGRDLGNLCCFCWKFFRFISGPGSHVAKSLALLFVWLHLPEAGDATLCDLSGFKVGSFDLWNLIATESCFQDSV